MMSHASLGIASDDCAMTTPYHTAPTVIAHHKNADESHPLLNNKFEIACRIAAMRTITRARISVAQEAGSRKQEAE